MRLLSFSDTRHGRTFVLSLTLFTIYTLTSVLRWLPVAGFQMPLIVICYVLLLFSCNMTAKRKVLALTLFLIVFDYFFIFLQDSMNIDSLQNRIGANYAIFMSLFPLLYAVSGNLDYINRRKYLTFIYAISLITAITTIIGTYVYESPCRVLATPEAEGLHALLRSHNIGGYGFIYFLVLLTPVLVWDIIQNKSIVRLLLLVVFGFCVYRSEYTTAFLMFFIAIVLCLIFNSKYILLKIISVILCLLLVINFQSIITWIGTNLFGFSYSVSSRIDMMSDYGVYGTATGDMANRQILYQMSLDAFYNNPFFGNLVSFSTSKPLGGHSEILDYLGGSGLFGLIVLAFFIYYLRNFTFFSRIKLSSPLIRSLLVITLLLAFINTFLSPELYYAILIVPFLVTYKKEPCTSS